jgi:NAD(P)-dependent dehydrogenase (short-subunit alcohol dehydrogenase family)
MLAYLGSHRGVPQANGAAAPVASDRAERSDRQDPRPGPAAVATRPPPRPRGVDELLELAVQLVSERTGYPPEMLDPDVHVEAALGIDSIKFMEVAGALQRAALPAGSTVDGLGEELSATRTLRGLAELIAGAAGANGRPEAPDGEAEVPRSVPVAVDLPTPSLRAVPADGVILITDDEGGVGPCLAKLVRAEGAEAACVGAADLVEASSVKALLARVRRENRRVRCVVHLMPLRQAPPVADMGPAAWRARLREDALALLHLTQGAACDLRSGGADDPGIVFSATSLGGAVAADGGARAVQPAQGAVAGYLKTLALEWPEVRARVIDFDPHTPAAQVAERLLAELRHDEDAVEVGYTADRRVTLAAHAAPLGESKPALDPDAVMLVIGGARGITAQAVRGLARRGRPTIYMFSHRDASRGTHRTLDGYASPRAVGAGGGARRAVCTVEHMAEWRDVHRWLLGRLT